MQVAIETIEGLKRKMTVMVPAERIDSAVEKKLHEVKGSVKIDGFRPGKVPFSVVKKRYAQAVRADVVNDVIQHTYGEALAQENINPAGMPSIDAADGDFLEGDFTYTASFEVYPEITLADLSKLEIEQANTEVNDADIDAMLEKLREQNKTWVEAERAAEDGDQVTIDFVGSMEGEKFEGGSAENVPVVIGSNSMIAGFEDGLIGLGTGDSKDLNLSFPEQYQAEHLAGKDAVFAVTVNKVEAPALPEIDDAFISKFGVKEGGIEALKEQLRKNMERECNAAKRQYTKAKAMDALLDAHEGLEVPEAMITQEIQQMIQNLKQQLQGQNTDELFKNTDAMRPEAERRVRLGLLLAEVISVNNIELDEAKLKAFVEEEASSYEDPQGFIDYYLNNEQNLNNIRPVVLEAQVVDYISETAKVTSKDISFDALVNQNQQGI